MSYSGSARPRQQPGSPKDDRRALPACPTIWPIRGTNATYKRRKGDGRLSGFISSGNSGICASPLPWIPDQVRNDERGMAVQAGLFHQATPAFARPRSPGFRIKSGTTKGGRPSKRVYFIRQLRHLRVPAPLDSGSSPERRKGDGRLSGFISSGNSGICASPLPWIPDQVRKDERVTAV